MARRKHSKETIIQILRNLSQRLGKKELSKREVNGVISVSSINYHFGSLGLALEAAGLKRHDPSAHLKQLHQRHSASEEDLFRSLLRVEERIKREPKQADYLALGQEYSVRPFADRWGKWRDVLSYYRKWKVERAHPDAGPAFAATNQSPSPMESSPGSSGVASPTPQIGQPQIFGEPIDFRALSNAPTNELGVIYLFGMVSQELGFKVEALQQGFPDCEGKYLHNPKKKLWAKARVEFEFRASSFKDHGHDAGQCDFIVCWENDWPDCPVTVVELSKEILRLPHGRGHD